MLPRWLITFRALALASAFAAAFVPIATYITDDKRDWLWIHIGVNIAAYIAVALTTIYTTINVTQQDHNKYRVPAYWSNNVVIRTWYLGVSKTWRWHVAAAVGRLGLALALAEHLHTINQIVTQDFKGIVAPFLYRSYPDEILPTHAFPQVETIVISLIVLMSFALLESGVLSAFTLLGYTFGGQIRAAFITGVFVRLAVILLFIGVMSGVHTLFNQATGPIIDPPYVFREAQDSLKEIHKMAFTWLDNGIMLSAWIMRPIDPDGWYACEEYSVSPQDRGCMRYNNRVPVAITVLHALLATLSYLLVINISVLCAQYLHWRREQGMNAHAPTDTSTA